MLDKSNLRVKENMVQPDYIDIDGDGDKSESMKDAAKDKKEGSPAKHITKFLDKDHQHNKNHDQRPMHSHKPFKPKKKDANKLGFKSKDERKGSPAKKYDRVVLGGNKGDKSKTKPGKKDYEK